MLLLQVMDKEKKLINRRFMMEHDDTEMNMYLTKQGDGYETLISWETANRSTSALELAYIKKFKKGKRPNVQPMNGVLDNDLPWGNIMKEKKEHNV